MDWVIKSLNTLLIAAGAVLTFYIADKIFKERYQWEMQAVIAKNEEQDEKIRFFEQDVMEKLRLMHGDIRKIEGKLER